MKNNHVVQINTQDAHTKKDEHLEHLRQNLTNLEKSIEEDVFTIDVSDLIMWYENK